MSDMQPDAQSADSPRRGLRLPGFLRRSLPARLVGAFLLLAALSVVIIVTIVNVRATADLQAAVLDRVDAAAGLRADAIQRWLDEQERSVIFLGGLFTEVASAQADIRALLEEGASPDEVAAATDSVRTTLDYVIRQTADAQELIILDIDGTIVVSTFPAHEGRVQSGEPYFGAATTETTVEGVFISSLTGAPTIAVATPIAGSAGEPIGVLAAMLDLEQLDTILLPQTGLGTTGATVLVSEEHELVGGETEGTAGGGLESEGIDSALSGTDGQGLYLNHRGIEVIGAWRWIPTIKSGLVTEMSQSEAFAPVGELSLVILGVGLASLALLALGALFIARTVTRPILGLASTATRVAGGDLTAHRPGHLGGRGRHAVARVQRHDRPAARERHHPRAPGRGADVGAAAAQLRARHRQRGGPGTRSPARHSGPSSRPSASGPRRPCRRRDCRSPCAISETGIVNVPLLDQRGTAEPRA